jgi:hypothetical protein
MRIIRDCKKRTISLDQTRYAEKVIKRFGQENCKPVSVSLPTRYNPRPHSTQNQLNATLRSHYQLVIGSLFYIMLGTRPDIALWSSKCHSSLPIQRKNICRRRSTSCAIFHPHRISALCIQELATTMAYVSPLTQTGLVTLKHHVLPLVMLSR